MNLAELLLNRRKKYYKKLSRYAKYIFNDHFVIVMVFLLGALAYQYTEFLKTVTPPFTLGKVIWAVVLAVVLFFGKLITLIQPADAVFLAAKEAEWQVYLKKVKPRSMLLPGFLLFCLLGLALPMLYIGETLSLTNFAALFATLLCLKWAELTLQENALHLGAEKEASVRKGLLFILVLATLLVAFLVNPWLGLGLSVAVAIGFNRSFYPLLHWEKLIQAEERRMAKINGVIHLFTDVPTVKNPARRRKYLDGLVRLLAGNGNPYQYLYARAFIRGGNYGGLFVRLTLIGMLLFSLTNVPILSILLNALFLYLTGFQMIALYGQFDEHVLTRIYPVPSSQKRMGFERLLFQLLILQSFLFSLATIIGSGLVVGAVVLGINILFSWGFAHFYLRNRTKKTDKWAF